MLDELKQLVCEANCQLPKHGLVAFTWGNVSGVDRANGHMVIKPSGVEYEDLSPEHMVVVELTTGKVVEGKLRPSSDTDTHLELYRKFPEICGIAHTHSQWATTFAQSRMGIPAFGTTHADYFYGEIPCTREMTKAEIGGSYELETGKVIVETFANKNPMEIPAVLVCNHGPFAWGTSPDDAVYHAVVLEECAKMAWQNLLYNPAQQPIAQELLDKHFLRKHGKNAYYGQKQRESSKNRSTLDKKSGKQHVRQPSARHI